MSGILFLSCWLFGLRLPTLEFVGWWVELGLGAEMRTSMRPHSDEYSLGSEVLSFQWFGLGAPTTGASARPWACEPRSCKPPGVAKTNKQTKKPHNSNKVKNKIRLGN